MFGNDVCIGGVATFFIQALTFARAGSGFIRFGRRLSGMRLWTYGGVRNGVCFWPPEVRSRDPFEQCTGRDQLTGGARLIVAVLVLADQDGAFLHIDIRPFVLVVTDPVHGAFRFCEQACKMRRNKCGR
ncbi:MAG TPA: hypothetical protein DIW52_04230 [Pseudomonas sp.]|nr:hypothetical protein [Pseudomonas sp.]